VVPWRAWWLAVESILQVLAASQRAQGRVKIVRLVQHCLAPLSGALFSAWVDLPPGPRLGGLAPGYRNPAPARGRRRRSVGPIGQISASGCAEREWDCLRLMGPLGRMG
jgi:hypothetical protein